MDHSQLNLSAPKLIAGDRVAVLSPSFAAPGIAPAVHEQAMRRLTAATGLIPVEFPTTRKLGSSSEERAADINAALADPSIRAILATIGGDDQITVVPHLDEAAVVANPKIFIGYSDNTNLLNCLWSLAAGREAMGQDDGVTSMSTFPMVPCSTASCAAAVSSSGKRVSGRPCSSPTRNAPPFSASETAATACCFCSSVTV
jgi:hypothetical protein